MSRYELSVSPNYVKDWSLPDAIREIFQNALDQESLDSENVMSFSYCNQTLSISSRTSSLSKSSLLFGNSTKSDDDSTIGQFGEGYKLALLVLVREGYDVTIFNYNNKEEWNPKFIKSRRFDSELLVVDVSKRIFFAPPNDNLTFEIKGISELDYDLIISKCLFMQKDVNCLPTSNGRILLDERHKGKVFVNGLFVCSCNDKTIRFGYDVKPMHLTLSRDRSLVDSFNLKWTTSKIWSMHKDKKFVAKLIVDKIPDVEYLDSHDSFSVSDAVYDEFTSNYGISSIPISEYEDMSEIKNDHPKLKPIIVSSTLATIIRKSSNFKSMLTMSVPLTNVKTPCEMLREFMDKHRDNMFTETINDLQNIIDKSEDWVNG